MIKILINRFAKKSNSTINRVSTVVLLTAAFTIFQLFALPVKASDIFSLNQKEYKAYSEIAEADLAVPNETSAALVNLSVKVGETMGFYIGRTTPHPYPNTQYQHRPQLGR